MTAKDFRLIAGVIATMGKPHGETLNDDERMNIACAFGHALAETNPGFDFGRFIAAAMGTPQTKRDAPGYRR